MADVKANDGVAVSGAAGVRACRSGVRSLLRRKDDVRRAMDLTAAVFAGLAGSLTVALGLFLIGFAVMFIVSKAADRLTAPRVVGLVFLAGLMFASAVLLFFCCRFWFLRATAGWVWWHGLAGRVDGDRAFVRRTLAVE